MVVETVLSKRIKHYRKLRKMTQEELAEEIGVTVDCISSVESGRRRLGLNTLVRVCECFHVTMSDILPLEECENPEVRVQWISEINETINSLDITQLGIIRAMICSLKP